MYDAGARPETFLREYAEEFATVEVDATYYGAPTVERAQRWAAQVPAGFTFALKLWREITHERRLLAPAAPLEEFLAGARAFEEKLEAVLVQLPPDFTPAEADALEAFVPELPADVRWALEVRDAGWFAGEPHRRLRDALGSHGIALAVTDAPFVARETMLEELRRPTASHAYVRWIGSREPVERFDRVTIDRSAEIAVWAAAIRASGVNVARLAGYANNHYAGHSPGTVRMLLDALGVPHRRPRRIEQTSLFSPP